MFQTWRSLTENKGVCNKCKNGDGLVSTDRSVVPRLCPLVMDNINIPFQQPGNNDLVVEAILCLLHMYTDCGTQKIQLILAPLSFLPPPDPPVPPYLSATSLFDVPITQKHAECYSMLCECFGFDLIQFWRELKKGT